MAEVSNNFFHIRDSFGVEIMPGDEDVIILAAMVAIDQIAYG